MKLLALTIALGLLPGAAAASSKPSSRHYLKALVLENEGDSAGAFEEYKNTLMLDEDALYVYRLAVRAAVRSGKNDEAIKMCEKLVKAEPQNSENWTLLGALDWARGEKTEARSAYEKAISLDPKNSEAVYQVSSMLKTSEPLAALKYLEGYAARNPEESAQALYEAALIYYQLDRRDDAAKALKRSISLDDDYLPPRFALAQLYEVTGSTAAALGEFLAIELKDPRNAALLAHVGELYGSAGKEAEAQAYFSKSKKEDGSNQTANFWLAVISEKHGDFESASKYLRESSAYERDPGLRLRASYYLTQAGHYRDAVAEMETAYAKWPENDELGYYLALGLDDTGDTPKALQILKKVTTSRPDFREAQIQYAVLSEKTNDIAEAEAAFKSVLAKTPDDPVVLNYLGYSLADRSLKLDEAEGYIKKALSLSPENGAYIDSLGWVHFRKGDYVSALSELKKAAALANDDETVWDHLGQIFAKNGNSKDGWYCFKISLAIKSSKTVRGRLSEIEKTARAADIAAWQARYLSAVYGGLKEFSALCKVTASAAGKEAEFSGILHYKANEALTLDLTGPMFTPAWKLKIASGTFEMTASDGENEKEPELRAAAEAMFSALSDYFTAAMLSAKSPEFSSNELKTDGAVIGLDSDGTKITGLKTGGKSELKFSNHQRARARHVANTLEFGSGRLSIKVDLTRWSASFDPAAIAVPQ